jgi:hypothetical protein
MSLKQLAPKYHGYEYPAPDCRGRFHFGTLRFFHTIEIEYCFPRGTEEKPSPNWSDRWFDRKFRQAVSKFTDTFHKIYLVAVLIEIERNNVFDNKDERDIEKYSKHLHGLRTIPVYLDSLLFYLRILADNIADLTPYLYPMPEGKQIANRSFRDHRKWFLKNNFDPVYKDILDSHSQWFYVLAGKAEGEGLRDKIIHHRGKFQISYTTASEVNDFKLTAGIVGDSGWLIDDIFPRLVSVTSELFTFLDHFVSHFSDYVAKKVGQSLFDLSNPYHTELFRFDEPLRSFWLFPSVSRDERLSVESI